MQCYLFEGTLPSPGDGVVNRTACIKFTKPCYRKLDIKIRNCGKSYIYHLTPPGLDDSGYCFGILFSSFNIEIICLFDKMYE
jgi:hypothetical protein